MYFVFRTLPLWNQRNGRFNNNLLWIMNDCNTMQSKIVLRLISIIILYWQNITFIYLNITLLLKYYFILLLIYERGTCGYLIWQRFTVSHGVNKYIY